MEVRGGFHPRTSFVTKDGTQTFDEIGDGNDTVVVTMHNKFRRAKIRKLDKKKQMLKITFRHGVYANTDTIICAAADQQWPIAARGEDCLRVGDRLECFSGEIVPWEVMEISECGDSDAWILDIQGDESFILRNNIPTIGGGASEDQ